MIPILKNDYLNSVYQEKGYVVIPLINEHCINDAVLFYNKYKPSTIDDLHPTHSKNEGKNTFLESNEIEMFLKSFLDKWFKNYQYFIGHFMIKAPNSSELRLHQDWSVCDERLYDSAQIWCPLVSTDETNGGLYVVEKSHKFFNNLRSGSLPISFISRTEKLDRIITKINIKAGEAVIYKQSLFHGSFANKTDKDRPVLMAGLFHQNAAMVYPQKVNNSSVEFYNINKQVFLKNLNSLEKGLLPEHLSVNSPQISYEHVEITEEQLLAANSHF